MFLFRIMFQKYKQIKIIAAKVMLIKLSEYPHLGVFSFFQQKFFISAFYIKCPPPSFRTCEAILY